MPLYTPESLETLRAHIDLADVLSTHIEIKRSGASYKALCPFHEEKTPSFTLQKGDSHYHCFGCGAHGDAIHFLMQYLRVSFQEAVEMLAHRFHVSLEVFEEVKERGPSRALLKEVLLQAGDLYHYLLLHTEEGHRAVQYLYQRSLSLESIRAFKVGWSSRGLFYSAMRYRGYSDEILIAAGLLKENGREFFSDRITFPICDPAGSIIGFSARKLREETFGGKYINTPETALFKKSKVLYGLSDSRRRIAKEARAIIVEGQLDALSLIFHGLNLAVAALGTAFGEEHAGELINLGVKRIYLAMDADRAGIEASKKVGNLFQKRGVEVKVISLPLGEDPDTFVQKRGIEAFSQQMESAEEYLSFLVKQQPCATPAAKTQLLQQIAEQIRQWDSPIMVHESLRHLAHLLQVPEEMVVSSSSTGHYLIKRSASAALFEIDPDRILESDLLVWLLISGERCFEHYVTVRKNLTVEDLRVEVCKKLFAAIDSIACSGGRWDLLTLASQCSAEVQELIDQMMRRKIHKEQSDKLLTQTIQKILDRNWMLQCEEISMRIRSGQLSDEEALHLVKELAQRKKNPPSVQ